MQALDPEQDGRIAAIIQENFEKKYIMTGTTPVFTGELEKLRGHWDAFVEYKSSELGL